MEIKTVRTSGDTPHIPVIEELNVADNGTYIAPVGVDGYSPVVVDVPNSYTPQDEGKVVSSGALVSQTTLNIDTNGTYDTTTNNSVVVNISPLEYYDYVSFADTTKGYIPYPDKPSAVILPYIISADYKATVEFYTSETYNMQAVFGNSANNYYAHLTQYNNRWYTSDGQYEVNFEKPTTGKHTYIINDDGYDMFDGDEVASYTPTTYNDIYYVVASRNDAVGMLPFTGKIYNFRLDSISTGDCICNLVPAKITLINQVVLYDIINSVAYPVFGCTVGNDEEETR